MRKERILKITALTAIIVLLAYFMFAEGNDKLPGTDQQKKEAQWNPGLPIVVITKDTMTYSALGIFLYTRQLDTALVSHNGSTIVQPIETPVERKVAWEIIIIYLCVLIIFILLGKSTKHDKPPPFWSRFWGSLVSLGVFVYTFGLMTGIFFCVSYIVLAAVFTTKNPVSTFLSDLEYLIGIQSDTFLTLKLVLLFEISVLVAVIVAFNTTLYTLPFGFDNNAWGFIMIVVILSIIGYSTGHFFTTRALKLEDEIPQTPNTAGEMWID